MPDFIRIENASFSYTGRDPNLPAVLANIDLRIGQGEFIALIGANGSGKSTLAKLLNALLLPDSGSVFVEGMDTRRQEDHSGIRSLVGMVFQRPQDQIVATTVEEDVAFGPANLGVESGEIRERVGGALALTGLSGYRQRPSYLLSAGETQRLALAGVLAMRPRCIIFDETTAMLDPAGREMVLAQIKELHRQGITTILITHLMGEAAQADRVLVLHQGRLVMDGSPVQVFSEKSGLEAYGLDMPPAYRAAEMLSRYIPFPRKAILRKEDLFRLLPLYKETSRFVGEAGDAVRGKAADLIAIDGLSFTYLKDTPLAHQALEEINLKVEKGQIHGLIGATGSGKSTILQHINGLILPQRGRVHVGPYDLNDEELDVKALRRMTALAFQQPEDQLFEQYVGDEVAYAPRRLGYEGKLADVVAQAMEAVGLDFDAYKDRLTTTLSGGEKRKVALASVLAIRSKILLLDEPFSGLDPRSNKELIGYLQEIHAKGCTLLISTHQYEELIDILDSVSVIESGRDVLHGSAQDVFGRTAELEKAGLRAPLAALTAGELRKKHWPITPQIASLLSLEAALSNIKGEGAG